jgi:hypothetical protein
MKFLNIILLSFLVCNQIKKSVEDYIIPTFLIHGIASEPSQLLNFENDLQNSKIGIDILNLGIEGDPQTSIYMSLDEQCKEYNNIINNYISNYQYNYKYKKYRILNEIVNNNKAQNLKIVKNKPLINIIGFSQGGLIARCILEKYNNFNFTINKIITIASPNMGVYYSNTNTNSNTNTISFTEYWRDPFTYENYLQSKKFLSRLNNEIEHLDNNKYKNNFKSVLQFITIWTNIDKVVLPPESAMFNYWNINLANKYGILEIEDVKNTTWYNEDKLGIKYLIDNNKYNTYMYPCNHDEFKFETCYNNESLKVNNKTLLETIIFHIY